MYYIVNSAVMQTLYNNPSYTVYDVDSPVFYIKLIKAAIKNYVPFIHWCKTANFMVVHCSNNTNDLAYRRIIDSDAYENL